MLERRRRDHLKYSFETLRAVVPGTSSDIRIPKVAILRRARDHVRQLTSLSHRLNAEYAQLKSLHQRWTYKLAALVSESEDRRSQFGTDDDLSAALVQAAA